jgi:hypothetical protein
MPDLAGAVAPRRHPGPRRLAQPHPPAAPPIRPVSPRRIAPEPERLETRDETHPRRSFDNSIKRTGWFAYVVRRDEFGHLRLAPAWPLWAIFVIFPVWWALGFGYFVFPLSAVPMAIELSRRRPLRIPRHFWIWGMFLLWNVLSMVMLGRTPAGTHPGTVSGRAVSVLLTLLQLASATVTLLFVSSLRKDELPQLRLARWMGVLFVVTVAGGVLGTVAPHFNFESPLELVLPHHVRVNTYVQSLVHPRSSQLQSVLGSEAGRASAPFGYTNTWANNLSLLSLWFIVGSHVNSSRARKVFCWVVIAVAMYPVVHSLNRGLWIGIAVTIVWFLGRLFLHGRIAPLLAAAVLLAVAAVTFLFSPLFGIYQARLAHPESNNIRAFLTTQSIKGAEKSPLLGWGGPRKTIGSSSSIAVGASPECQSCGNFGIGTNGQLWSVLFDQGVVGTIFFLGFFGAAIWVYRRERSPYAQAATIVVMLTFVYMLFYNSVPVALTITMISIGMMWRLHDPEEPRPNPRRTHTPHVDPVRVQPLAEVPERRAIGVSSQRL